MIQEEEKSHGVADPVNRLRDSCVAAAGFNAYITERAGLKISAVEIFRVLRLL